MFGSQSSKQAKGSKRAFVDSGKYFILKNPFKRRNEQKTSPHNSNSITFWKQYNHLHNLLLSCLIFDSTFLHEMVQSFLCNVTFATFGWCFLDRAFRGTFRKRLVTIENGWFPFSEKMSFQVRYDYRTSGFGQIFGKAFLKRCRSLTPSDVACNPS